MSNYCTTDAIILTYFSFHILSVDSVNIPSIPSFIHQMVNEMTLENDKLTASNDKFRLENDKYVHRLTTSREYPDPVVAVAVEIVRRSPSTCLSILPRTHHFFTRLAYVTRDIESLAATMGIGVDRLNSSIEEFDAITKEMNRCLEQQVMQQVLDIVMKVDRDKDFHIKEPREIKQLQQRLSSIPNVEFHEENFRRITQCDSEDSPGIKVGDIMAMFRNLKDPSANPEENIFVLHPEEQIRKQYTEKRENGAYDRRRMLSKGDADLTLDIHGKSRFSKWSIF